MLGGCSTPKENTHFNDNGDISVKEQNNNDINTSTNNSNQIEKETNVEQNDDEFISKIDDKNNQKNKLAHYSDEQIEYARVWLQLGPNENIEKLNVNHIKAGEVINNSDETSAKYPEDVIQLSGTRLVDGAITYSGNGDGTINVYNVPLRWDGKYPAGEQFYIDIIENTKLVNVNRGDDDEVVKFIKLLNLE